jgi:hypothetical protein
LEADLRTRISALIAAKRASSISLYFRDLTTGQWIGVNEDKPYYAASLNKVPLLVTYLRAAQSDPLLLGKTLLFDGALDADHVQNIKPPETLVAGKSYSIESLLRIMIHASDNNAFQLLWKNAPTGGYQKTFDDLSIPFKLGEQSDFLMDARSYSRFFRVLYNATYLDRDHSRQALDILSDVDFQDGLVAGVASSTTVAHKFGEHGDVPAGDAMPGSAELHDCGIVYLTNHPYSLCLLTAGPALEPLKGVLKDLSALVYASAAQGAK